ncbi:YidC/Oxa1 family membrane protein insertase [Shewanella waksmanii]|uniref:YidC/Oxa1 family membrane protein insertase n=1 Tax=Shewanella waksmanii TaxID=213783 RepID=UPI00048E8883|nr:YidC/Oxa1 family membrane protein insertase [Shewanella waksmanii]
MWNELLSLTHSGLLAVQLQFGLSDALAIIVFVSLIRLVLLPLSLRATYQQYVQRAKLAQLSPQLEQIKASLPLEQQFEVMQALRQRHGIKMMSISQLVNATGQAGVGLALFSSLKQLGINSAFYWIENIAKPDYLLALVVSFLTFVTMMVAPGEVSWWMALLPAGVAVIALMSFPATIAMSYAVSTLWTLLQSALCQWYLACRKVEKFS